MTNYCNPEGFKNEIRSLWEKGNIDAFYDWFDGGLTREGAFEKGEDVFNRVIFPFANKYIGKQLKKGATALDLGYGAGTKVQAATNFFKKVIGVDVHDLEEDMIKGIEPKADCEIDLIKSDGHTIPVGENEVDFLYSWVVFCHLGTIDNVRSYLREIHRVLNPSGIAVLYFTRLIRSKNYQTIQEVDADMAKELSHPTGYREGGPESKVRTINLVMSMAVMEDLSQSYGFEILEKTVNWSNSPQGKVYHGQHGIVLRKPAPKKRKAPKKTTIQRRKKSE